MGIEPTTTRLRVLRSTIWATKASWEPIPRKMRPPGIEPGPPAWKADILPLNYRRGLRKIRFRWYSVRCSADIWMRKIHPPRIELGTSRVLGERHNQLDQGCLYTWTYKCFNHQIIEYISSRSDKLLSKKVHPPRIELGTSRVWGERHNQLDQGCDSKNITKHECTADSSQSACHARYEKISTPTGFEPVRAKPNGLAGRRLNHSAKASVSACLQGNHITKYFTTRQPKLFEKNTFGGDRTHGQQLKRLSLYRLSYEGCTSDQCLFQHAAHKSDENT